MRRVLMVLSVAAVFAGAVTGAAVSAKTGISVSPTSVNFGDVSVGTTAYADITITNDTGKTLNNQKSDVPNSGVFGWNTFGCYTLNPGATCTMQIMFVPGETRSYGGSMSLIYQDASGSRLWKVSWKVSGTGV